MKRKMIGLLIFVVLSCVILSGCKNGGKKSSIKKWDKDVTLTWWLVGGTDEYYQHYWSEMKSFQKIQENTGIKIEFKVAINYDAYLPMMSAKTYPDVITAANLMKYTGRMEGMYADGVSIKLNEYMDEYMPNFSKMVKDNPDFGRDVRIADGAYTFLSTFYDPTDDIQRALTSTGGLMIRKDWLDTVGEEIPTNMEEWYKVLKAFKQQDPNGNGEVDEEPFVACSSGWKYFMPAYGIDDDPSLIKDESGKEKVVFGYITDNYKEYLSELNKWYTENLIYYMFDGVSIENQRERILGNFAGSWKGGAGQLDESDPTSFINQLKAKAPDVKMAAVPWPKTADGYQWCFSDIGTFHKDSTVITSNAVKDGVDKAAAYLLDYLLSEEGSTILTWGVEGESYEVVGGEKKLMDGMTDIIDFYGHKMQKINTYADNITVAFPARGDIVADYVFSQKTKEYKDACYTWAKGDTSYKLLAPCQLSVKLETEAATIEDEMKSYMSKMRNRFITGKVPLTNYDTYIDQCKLLGGDKFTEIWQSAYDEYLKR